MLLPYTLGSLGLDFTQMVLAVRKHLDMAIMIILNNLEQPILMQFFQKFTLWGKSLLLHYTLGSLGLDFTQMVLAVPKHLLSPIHLQDGRKWKYSLYGFIICIFPDQLSMEILRGENRYIQYRDFMNISVFALLIVHGNIKGRFRTN